MKLQRLVYLSTKSEKRDSPVAFMEGANARLTCAHFGANLMLVNSPIPRGRLDLKYLSFWRSDMKDRTDCMNCVLRMLECIKSSEYTVKQISYIFGMDASDVNRRFRLVKGLTLKGYLDQLLKQRLIGLLGEHRSYGYQYASALEFSSDRAFYRWVKRVFDMSFSQLKDGHQNPL